VFTTVDAVQQEVSLTSNDRRLCSRQSYLAAELVDSSTGMPKATQVSWQTDANGNPINFAKGRACIADATVD
jgi:hypothetical protein